MNNIKVLDCTLRDGGYVNQWCFGEKNIKTIIECLCDSNIDIIECGFLEKSQKSNCNVTKFNSISIIEDILPKQNREGKVFVCMMEYGHFDVDDLPMRTKTSVDGIRVSFHKKDFTAAIEVCIKIKEKGYLVFVQPTASLLYTDIEFVSLINQVNALTPYAFYIVDTFGSMKKKDLIRLFYMTEHNLDNDICIGFHSHNNLQLSYSNAQVLLGLQTIRNLIVDSSIFGMGRGAGNLNTELFVQFLNDNFNYAYKINPLFRVIDDVLIHIYDSNFWGYSLPYCISAANNCHPYYASFLDNKKTLTIEAISELLALIDEGHRLEFDKEYINDLYVKYMNIDSIEEFEINTFKRSVKDAKVLIICPGRTSEVEKEKIIKVCNQSDVLTISVNFEYPYAKTDYIFVSNLKRYQKLKNYPKSKMIITSNIETISNIETNVKYSDLTNNVDEVTDNAGLMAIKFSINMGATKIFLAGMDGFSHIADENYINENMTFITSKDRCDAMNNGICEVLKSFAKKVDISFVTDSKYKTQ